MKKNVFHRGLLTSLRLATGKAKRAAKILTSNQQQTLPGLAGTSFITMHRGQGALWASQTRLILMFARC
jgi:hypothetical protein